MSKLRLDKYLAAAGLGTRSEVKEMIKKKQIEVNDSTLVTPELKIDPKLDLITHLGCAVTYSTYEYYMLNKPAGYVSATNDNVNKTVVSLIPSNKQLFPVGRLDKDTEGLLLLTNDGSFAHNLLSPKKHISKSYFAQIKGIVTAQDIKLFESGLDIGDQKQTLPAQLTIHQSGAVSEITVIIYEGRYHQVKRMFEAVGKKVIYLKRIAMGSLRLDETLPLGAYRELTASEINQLKKLPQQKNKE